MLDATFFGPIRYGGLAAERVYIFDFGGLKDFFSP